MRIYRLDEANNKDRFFKKVKVEKEEDREKLIKLYSRQEIPDNLVDWSHIENYTAEELEKIATDFLKANEEKKNKKSLSRAVEGRDYIKIFEKKNSRGTEYLYLPLTWNGSKYLASDHFAPKIKVPSKVMNANDFSDNTAKNTDLSPGAKWCISLWTLPDLVIDDIPVTDENGKELRHEGKRYWLDYTSQSYYFLFYFRDYANLDDINKKIALTLKQGSSKIEDITLADDTIGKRTTDINKVQEYWDKHHKEYESQIKLIQEVSKEESPKFERYEKQKEQEAGRFTKYSLIKKYFLYNEETGRYDSKGDIGEYITYHIVEDGEFTIPIGVINGNFNCHGIKLESLRNGPTEVEGDFYCHSNRLTTLEYAPKKVRGSFYCGGNNLTTLKGAPEYVGESFSCIYNKLTTLEGAPREIEGYFDCSNNNLKTLEGASQKVGRSFYCKYNQLTTLEGAPQKVGGSFICDDNRLTTLEGSPEYVGENFGCSYNKLKTLKGAPKKVGGDFYCKNNPLRSRELSTELKGYLYY